MRRICEKGMSGYSSRGGGLPAMVVSQNTAGRIHKHTAVEWRGNTSQGYRQTNHCQSVLTLLWFVWLVSFAWFKERKKPDEPGTRDQPVSPFICAFSINARLSSTIAKVS